jgi:hypothetical protein
MYDILIVTTPGVKELSQGTTRKTMGDNRTTRGVNIIRLGAWTSGGAIAGGLVWFFSLRNQAGYGDGSLATVAGVGDAVLFGALLGLFFGAFTALLRLLAARYWLRHGVQTSTQYRLAGNQRKGGERGYAGSYGSARRSISRIPRKKEKGLSVHSRAVILTTVLLLGLIAGVLLGRAELASIFGPFNLLIYATVAVVIILVIMSVILEQTNRDE